MYKDIKENIDFLKSIVEKRETYIRFSPLWTAIMWIMYIFYYFIWGVISDLACDFISCMWFYQNMKAYLFLAIWILWAIIVCILSLINSESRWEKLLPKSIRFIIINLWFIWITFFSIILTVPSISGFIIPISFLFYGILIIVSRFSIPDFIKYYGLVVFMFGLILIYGISSYTDEIILVAFWLWHLVMAFLLMKKNRSS